MGREIQTTVRMVIPYKIVVDKQGKILEDECVRGPDISPDYPQGGYGLAEHGEIEEIKHPSYALHEGELVTNFRRFK